MEDEKKSSGVSDVGAWGMNVVSSVGIIMANKQLMSPAGYAFSFGLFFRSVVFGSFIYWVLPHSNAGGIEIFSFVVIQGVCV